MLIIFLNYILFKSLCFLDSIVCNDMSISRTNRLRNVMQQFFHDWEKKVTITNNAGAEITTQTFSKVSVKVISCCWM